MFKASLEIFSSDRQSGFFALLSFGGFFLGISTDQVIDEPTGPVDRRPFP
jgi:hypothetical protein